MKNLRTASFLFLTVLAASSLIVGCKSNSSSPASTPAIPTVGSTFTVSETNNGSYDTIVYTVIDTNLTNLPTSKIIGLSGHRLSNNSYSSMALSYESNGDVSIKPDPSGNPATWQTLPFVSQIQNNSAYGEGSLALGDSTDVNSFAAGSGAGSLFQLNGQSYSTDSVTLTESDVIIASYNGTITRDTAPAYYHYTYLPAIGLIGISDVDDGAQDRVIAYTPK